MTPLHHAAAVGDDLLIKLLLSAGSDPSLQDKWGYTPLGRAVAVSDCILSTQSLLEAILKFGHTDMSKSIGRRSWTGLHIAAVIGDEVGASNLLKAGLDVEAEDLCGITPLHIASEYGHCGVATTLLEVLKGSICKSYHGLTPLHFAKNVQMVNILISKSKADVSAQDHHGWTPLHRAILRGNLPVVKVLLPLTDLVSQEHLIVKNPLHLAMWCGDKEIIKYLRQVEPALANFGSTTSDSKIHTVFSLKTLIWLDKPSDDFQPRSYSRDKLYGTSLLEKLGNYHLTKKNLSVASLCFDLATIIHRDNVTARNPTELLHDDVFCRRCTIEPVKGFCYRCTNCFIPQYDLCADCYEKRWQFGHMHNQFLRIPSSTIIPNVDDLFTQLQQELKE